MKMIRIRLSLLIMGFMASLTAAQKTQNLDRKIDSLFTKYIKSREPGAAVVVVKDGQILHKNAYGLANLEYQIPLRTSSVFDIASVSKQFLGYSVAKLILEKRIDLEDDIRTHIPEFPDFGYTITIRHLLYHQSGLRDWPGTMKLAGVDYSDSLSFQQILDMVYNQKDLNFVPGTDYSYSNTGYNVLVEVVQRITKQSFRDWTNANIFEPLGMGNTFFKDDYKLMVSNQVDSYFKNEGQLCKAPNNLSALGSSSLQTNIDDLTKWLLYLDSESAKDYIKMMRKTGVLNSGATTNYGFGLEIDSYGGLERMAHDGGWASFNTYLAYLPDQHFSVAILMNRNGWPQGFAENIMDLVLSDQFKNDLEDKEESGINPELPKEELKLNLTPYIGTYFLEKYMVYVTITEKNGTLYTQATGEDKFPMTAISAEHFWIDAYDSSMYFHFIKDASINGFTYHDSHCPKLEPIQSNSAEALNQFTGVYWSEELHTSYDIKLIDNQLYLSNIRNGKLLLSRVWNNGFSTEAIYAPIVEFQRDATGELVSFTATQKRSRDQKFIKIK